MPRETGRAMPRLKLVDKLALQLARLDRHTLMDCALMFGVSLPTVSTVCAHIPRSSAGIDDEFACHQLAEMTLNSIGAAGNLVLWDELLLEATAILESKRALLSRYPHPVVEAAHV